ncbi:hypothetical protein Trydic_g22013, partial [Trypoxylus dichotomus]
MFLWRLEFTFYPHDSCSVKLRDPRHGTRFTGPYPASGEPYAVRGSRDIP